jgi:hypothetical protein
MTHKILLLIFLFFNLPTWAQTITVKGKVVDDDKEGIKNTKVIYGTRFENYELTDEHGNFQFKIELSNLDSLVFKRYGFDKKTLVISEKQKKKIKNNELNINVSLNYHTFNEVIVSFTPKIVFGSPNYSVADFELYDTNKLVLLTYEKNQKKGGVLRLVDSTSKVLDRYYIVEETIELKKDYKGNLHLITKNNVYWILINDDVFSIYKEDKKFFYQYLAPVIDTINDRIYYSNYSDLFPAFNYLEYNKTDSVYKTLIAVIDKPMMEQYRAEFKFVDVRTQLWAHRKELETGIDKEIWVGASVFTNTLYYEPLYAPLFVQNDSVYIFDHYKNKLFKYTTDKGTVDSLRITYHIQSKKSGWEQPLIQDKISGKIYAMFMRGGYTYLSLIDLNTGQITKTFKLFYKYVEKIQIINDEIFYIYRPFESVQKKYIYKEEISFD